MTSESLTHSPAFSTTNLSEISDFEFIDQDRDAWSSNPELAIESDLDDHDSIALSRNSSSSLLHVPSHSQSNEHIAGVDADSTEAWNTVPARRSTHDLLVERNQLVAERLGNEISTDGFESVIHSEERAEREESPDRTLTDISVSQPDLVPTKAQECGQASSLDAVSSPDPNSLSSSDIDLVFPDPSPMDESVMSLPKSDLVPSLVPHDADSGPPNSVTTSDIEAPTPATVIEEEQGFEFDVEDIDTDADIPSSARFTSTTTSSLYSLSPNNSVLSFNHAVDIDVEEPDVSEGFVQARAETDSEREEDSESDLSSDSDSEPEIAVEEQHEEVHAAVEAPVPAIIQLVQEDPAEHDLPLMAGGIPPPLPFHPPTPRERSSETVREILRKEKIVKSEMQLKVCGRRLEGVSRRNLIVSVLSVLICSAACLLYGWKSTMSKFDIGFGLGSFNRSGFTSTPILSNLRSPTVTDQEIKLNSTHIPSPVEAPSPGPSSIPMGMGLTIDPTPALRTIDGPTPRLLISSTSSSGHGSGTSTSVTALITGSRADLGTLLPKGLSKYIPPSHAAFPSTSKSEAEAGTSSSSGIHAISSSGPFGFTLLHFPQQQIENLKSKFSEAHSAFQSRHARAKANAKKLGKRVFSRFEERCGVRCEQTLSDLGGMFERVGEEFGNGLRVGVRGGEVGGEG